MAQLSRPPSLPTVFLAAACWAAWTALLFSAEPAEITASGTTSADDARFEDELSLDAVADDLHPSGHPDSAETLAPMGPELFDGRLEDDEPFEERIPHGRPADGSSPDRTSSKRGRVAGDPCSACFPTPDKLPLQRILPKWDVDWEAIKSTARFRHSSTDGRHVGMGDPLLGTSWLNRPYHAGWFIGSIFGESLIPGRVRQLSDFVGGYEMGWDVDHYWGTQLRLAWAAIPNENEQGEPFRRTGDVFLGDVSVLYYPWGDSRWRPYAVLGMGLANFNFVDDVGQRRDATLLSLPFGGGIKYQFRRWLALRSEVLDNFALGDNGVSSMHNASLTIGIEIHWGADRTTYWPWNPGRHVW
jgi:hypothetical protein